MITRAEHKELIDDVADEIGLPFDEADSLVSLVLCAIRDNPLPEWVTELVLARIILDRIMSGKVIVEVKEDGSAVRLAPKYLDA